MTTSIKTISSIEFESNLYPVTHWRKLKEFAVGNVRDPRGLFLLKDDKWEGWPYSPHGMPSLAREYRLNFGSYKTFLKLYVKWYCYFILTGKPGLISLGLSHIPVLLMRADRYISERGFKHIDEIAPSTVFEALWAAQIRGEFDGPLPPKAVSVQLNTRTFWLSIKTEFGAPHIVPLIAAYTAVNPAEYAADRSKIIPRHVLRHLTNKLALHREEKELLYRYDHLRLCVLVLAICLGRRIHEVLLAPRGSGPDGTLRRRPSRGRPLEGSLWVQFLPNKEGPNDQALISSGWEEVTQYCVRELVKYSDEVRRFAPPEEQGLLILVSRLNLTRGPRFIYPPAAAGEFVAKCPDADAQPIKSIHWAGALKYVNFTNWLNGTTEMKGIFQLWGITVDGTVDGSVYRLLPSFMRHTRQSALDLDPHISWKSKQSDLNHRDPDVQLVYQHRLRENKDTLLEKIREGRLFGRGLEWLEELLGIETKGPVSGLGCKPGRPQLMTPQMRAAIRNNPLFLQPNLVPGGICVLPQGPPGCAEFLNCTSAGEGGCHSFITDIGDARMLRELNERTNEERRLHGESVSAGRKVQANKREVVARRTEALRDEAMRRSTKEVLLELKAMEGEVKRNGL